MMMSRPHSAGRGGGGGLRARWAALKRDEDGVPSPGAERRARRQVMRVEPVSLASKPLQSTGISVPQTVRLFNAELDFTDSRERPLPYLADALPQLHTPVPAWR